MSKKAELPAEGVPLTNRPEKADEAPLVTEWEELVRLWADKSNVPAVAQVLQDELERAGIYTAEAVAAAPVKVLAAAARAALQADAYALQAAAFLYVGGKS